VTLSIDPDRLVRILAFVLRHEPARFGLDLDDEGWTNLEDLVIAIRFDRYDWALVDEAALRTAIEGMDRFQIRDGRIRATYGHSIQLGKLPPAALPPTELFHGTTNDALPAICRDGLRPIGRRFVHLTSDREYAICVANAKKGQAIVRVRAADAHASGRVFRRANDHVWLTDKIEASFLATEPEQVRA
jgi:putative RNA 2'-phosphotransferase